MFHIPEKNSSFYLFLLQIDQDTVRLWQSKACPFCAGPLDRADYPRKPRGHPDGLSELFQVRFSLCCRAEGCRKRTTPPSVRFFNRYVYLMFFIVIVSSSSSRSMSKLSKTVGISRQTLKRWRLFWQKTFPGSQAWKMIRPMFMPPPNQKALPRSLIKALGGLDQSNERLILILALVAFGNQDHAMAVISSLL